MHVSISLLAIPELYGVHPYVYRDVVNLLCLSDLNIVDVMNATCTMEESGRPDSQMLNCISTTEDTSTSDGIQRML